MPEPTIGDMERWLLRRGITLREYEAMPWVRRDFLYSEFTGEWGEDNPAGVKHEASLEEMRRELRERFERLKKGNPSPQKKVVCAFAMDILDLEKTIERKIREAEEKEIGLRYEPTSISLRAEPELKPPFAACVTLKEVR